MEVRLGGKSRGHESGHGVFLLDVLICYVDEAGDFSTLDSASSPNQPVFCLLGLAFEAIQIKTITERFLELKREFFPKKFAYLQLPMQSMVMEIKGSDIRTDLRNEGRNAVRHHYTFLDKVLQLVEEVKGSIFARIWIKSVGQIHDHRALYTSSVQHVCRTFDKLLNDLDKNGVIIADSRAKAQNVNTSFSIFTQKFAYKGDAYPRLWEMPTFSHSENHAGLQIADLIVSGILYPLSSHVYCSGQINSVHVHPKFGDLKGAFGRRLKDLQFRYFDALRNQWNGGLIVNDPLGRLSSQLWK